MPRRLACACHIGPQLNNWTITLFLYKQGTFKECALSVKLLQYLSQSEREYLHGIFYSIINLVIIIIIIPGHGAFWLYAYYYLITSYTVLTL